MSTITQVVTTLPVAPNSSTDTPQDFNAKANTFVSAQVALVPEVNLVVSQMNVVAGEVNTNKNTAVTKAAEAAASELLARGSANYQGEWVAQGYTLGQGVSVSGVFYVCKLTHTTAQTPAEVSTYWTLNSSVTLNTAQTISAVKTFSVSPIVPNPTTDTQSANKGYVDTKQTKGEVAYSLDSSTYIANTLPSGAIIEKGTNANGGFVKFSDGTLICRFQAALATVAAGGDTVAVWTFPHAFIEKPIVSNTAASTDIAANKKVLGTLRGAFDATQVRLVAYNLDSVATDIAMQAIAVGRWR